MDISGLEDEERLRPLHRLISQWKRKRITTLDREELGWVLSKGIADGWKQFLLLPNAEVLAMSQLQLSLIHQAHTLLEPFTRSYLYAGAYALVGLALHQREHHEEALHAYHNGHLAAMATGDPWYVAQSLICQADGIWGLACMPKPSTPSKRRCSALGKATRSTGEPGRTCWAVGPTSR